MHWKGKIWDPQGQGAAYQLRTLGSGEPSCIKGVLWALRLSTHHSNILLAAAWRQQQQQLSADITVAAILSLQIYAIFWKVKEKNPFLPRVQRSRQVCPVCQSEHWEETRTWRNKSKHNLWSLIFQLRMGMFLPSLLVLTTSKKQKPAFQWHLGARSRNRINFRSILQDGMISGYFLPTLMLNFALTVEPELPLLQQDEPSDIKPPHFWLLTHSFES